MNISIEDLRSLSNKDLRREAEFLDDATRYEIAERFGLPDDLPSAQLLVLAFNRAPTVNDLKLIPVNLYERALSDTRAKTLISALRKKGLDASETEGKVVLALRLAGREDEIRSPVVARRSPVVAKKAPLKIGDLRNLPISEFRNVLSSTTKTKLIRILRKRKLAAREDEDIVVLAARLVGREDEVPRDLSANSYECGVDGNQCSDGNVCVAENDAGFGHCEDINSIQDHMFGIEINGSLYYGTKETMVPLLKRFRASGQIPPHLKARKIGAIRKEARKAALAAREAEEAARAEFYDEKEREVKEEYEDGDVDMETLMALAGGGGGNDRRNRSGDGVLSKLVNAQVDDNIDLSQVPGRRVEVPPAARQDPIDNAANMVANFVGDAGRRGQFEESVAKCIRLIS